MYISKPLQQFRFSAVKRPKGGAAQNVFRVNLSRREHNHALVSLVSFFTSLTSFVSFIAFAQESASEGVERIEVTSRTPHYQQSLSEVLPQTRVLDDTSHSSDSLAELLINAPEISLNGQGGLLQSVNIRGFSRWRIQTLVEGIPVYTERRAGSSAEFVSPAMVSDAFITAGAASTQLGSGAIGGGLDIQLAQPQKQQVKLALGDNQDYRDVLAQGVVALSPFSSTSSSPASSSNDSLGWAINHRHANNSTDGNGDERLDGFEQQSVLLRYRTGQNGRNKSHDKTHDKPLRESLFYWSEANNIGKASADDPASRFTLYPTNAHVLGKITFNWHNAAMYFHDGKLETFVTRPGNRTNFTRNEALDFGVQFSNQFNWRKGTVNWRTSVDARTGVKATEVERSILNISDDSQNANNTNNTNNPQSNPLVFDRINLDGEQWEASLALDTQQPILLDKTTSTSTGSSPLHWVGGLRLARHLQRDNMSGRANNSNQSSAFLGLAYQPVANWKTTAYVSSAYRVPSLTELYFNGSTPRGTVLGDPHLKTEKAINVQLGLHYEQSNSLLELNVFRQQINDYIERLTINDELRQYRNLDSADIQGLSYRWQQQGSAQLQHSAFDWQWQISGQWLNGENQAGAPIQDIVPAEHRITWRILADKTQSHLALRYRQRSTDEVSGELPTSGITTLDFGLTHQFSDAYQFNLTVSNLTNKLYVTSRDDLAPFARGRNIQVGVTMGLD